MTVGPAFSLTVHDHLIFRLNRHVKDVTYKSNANSGEHVGSMNEPSN
jgi:hypothetical protein